MFPCLASAVNLSVKLDGELPKEVKSNVLSYLGTLPETELERSAFIYSAEDNALHSLGLLPSRHNCSCRKRSLAAIANHHIVVKLNSFHLQLDMLDITLEGLLTEFDSACVLKNILCIKPAKADYFALRYVDNDKGKENASINKSATKQRPTHKLFKSMCQIKSELIHVTLPEISETLDSWINDNFQVLKPAL